MKQVSLGNPVFSPEDFFRLGMNDTAYVKPMVVRGQSVYVVCAVDSTPIMIATEREAAFAAARQHNMTPASVH